MKKRSMLFVPIGLLISLCTLTACSSSSGTAAIDTTAPTAIINFPPPASSTDGSTVTVRGTATDDSQITTVRVNGTDVTTSDNFASWEITVNLSAGVNTLTVDTADIESNADNAATSVQITMSNVSFPDAVNPLGNPESGVLDKINNRVLIIDGGLDALLAVDLAPGASYATRSVISDDTNPNSANPFAFPSAVVLDNTNNRVLVTDAANQVLSVDLTPGATFGARSVVSNNTTPDTVNPFNLPQSGILDSANNRLLVINVDSLMAVDLTPGATFGARTLISNNTTPDTVNPFIDARGLVLDSANNRVLVADGSGNKVLAVDLTPGATFGARTIVSDSTTPDTVNPFSIASSIELDSANNRVLVTNQINVGLLAVDLTPGATFGARTVISNNSTVPDNVNPFSQMRDSILDEANNMVLIGDDNLDALFAVDLVNGQRVYIARKVTVSDRRLKKDIVYLSSLENGIKLYSFKYLWSDETYVGVMAQDLLNTPAFSHAVHMMPGNFYAVDYQALGLKMISNKQGQRAVISL